MKGVYVVAIGTAYTSFNRFSVSFGKASASQLQWLLAALKPLMVVYGLPSSLNVTQLNLETIADILVSYYAVNRLRYQILADYFPGHNWWVMS